MTDLDIEVQARNLAEYAKRGGSIYKWFASKSFTHEQKQRILGRIILTNRRGEMGSSAQQIQRAYSG